MKIRILPDALIALIAWRGEIHRCVAGRIDMASEREYQIECGSIRGRRNVARTAKQAFRRVLKPSDRLAELVRYRYRRSGMDWTPWFYQDVRVFVKVG